MATGVRARRRPPQRKRAGVALTPFMGFLRYMPVPVFIPLTILWLGLVCRRADVGLTQILSGDGRGSAAIRYLMLPTIFAPVVLASVRLWGESSGWQGTPFTASLFGTFQSMLRIATILGLGYLLVVIGLYRTWMRRHPRPQETAPAQPQQADPQLPQ